MSADDDSEGSDYEERLVQHDWNELAVMVLLYSFHSV